MIRLFILSDAICGSQLVLSKDEFHHLVHVLRVQVFDHLELVVDSDYQVMVCVTQIGSDRLSFEVISRQFLPEPLVPFITLVQAMPSQDKFSFILQSGTQVGFDMFIPIVTSRSSRLASDQALKKHARWASIVKQASEQSKRFRIPNVLDLMTLDSFFLLLSGMDSSVLKLILWEDEVLVHIKEILNSHLFAQHILVVVGPEGGFSVDEVDRFIDYGFQAVSLGDTIFRTENAGIIAAAMIRYAFFKS